QVLTLGTLVYLACLPLGWLSYREHQRKDAVAAAAATSAAAASNVVLSSNQPVGEQDDDRPTRLN
ncbi:MAG: CDP-diacylglycerol--serine O-phosphatidyltransferase, partial [Pseudolabrys sp.]